MDYKYRKGQIFGKRLPVPKNILNKVYNCTLTLEEYYAYHLDDKIPTSCIAEFDRKIVDRFGVEKCKKLDFETLTLGLFYSSDVNIRNVLLSIDPKVDDINLALYEALKDKIRPTEYSSKMKEIYSDRVFDLSMIKNYNLLYYFSSFNDGKLSLGDIVTYWEFFGKKDLSVCLKNDPNASISSDELKMFMKNYGFMIPLISEHVDIYTFINEINEAKTEDERKGFIKKYTDEILSNTRRKYGDFRPAVVLSDEEYRTIFKYSSLTDYLKEINSYRAEPIIEELKTLPEDYIFDLPIPFHVILDDNVMSFISTYGLKNVVDFDNECGHFFSKNNCEMLKLMYDMYLHYANNEHDPNKSVHTINPYDEEGHFVKRGYTKDEFYEAMRRMIVYGPSDFNYMDKAPDYRDMTGEFRIRNAELFISEDAPEELQKLFYTKEITSRLLVDHPEFIEYLRDKDLGSCFKSISVKVNGSDALYEYENLYNFLNGKFGFDKTIEFVTSYSDIFDVLFDIDSLGIDYFYYSLKFSIEDSLEDVQTKSNRLFRRLVIEKGIPYAISIPNSFIEQYPNMFIRDDAPDELQDAFYNRKINAKFIINNPSYMEYLKDVDIELLFRYMPVRVYTNGKPSYYRSFDDYESINLVKFIEKSFGRDEAFDIMFSYGKYLESIYDIDRLRDFSLDKKVSKDKLFDEIDDIILKNIMNGKIKYDDKLPDGFKKKNPTLFLDDKVPSDIKAKFYNREFSISDFTENLELLETIGDANIAFGLPQDMSWAISLFKDDANPRIANLNRVRVLAAYEKIDDVELKKAFVQFIIDEGDNIYLDKINNLSTVLHRLSLSNSSEIFRFRKELASQILASDDPLQSLGLIEDLFVKNNIPTVGKIYSCFEILHPAFQGFNFEYSNVSPILKKASTGKRRATVFSDLIKASFGSNNKSVNAYLRNIDIGSRLYDDIRTGKVQYENLSDEEKSELQIFGKHLETLYNNTLRAKTKNDIFASTGDVLTDILELSKKLSSNGDLDYNLGDRVIRMFCGFAGISSVEEAKQYISGKVRTADQRNRSAATGKMVLERGDFVKGIGDITYLRNILQNGSVSKEFLGSSADSDATPLDTDVSMIMQGDTPREMISSTAAAGYGPIWFVLKNDDRFITTRTSTESFPDRKDTSKLEVFHTGVLGEDHYGIRTGFASSEINYIVMDSFDPRVGLEIVLNGFYIPIANKDGEIIFTPDDYDMLREKMSGLSYYGEEEFKFSPNLVNEDISLIALEIEESNRQTNAKREKINEVMRSALEELGLKLKTNIDGDLTEGYVELIDTGSTGRGTNKPGDGDFDFMMRLDKTILSDPKKLGLLKQTILQKLGKENSNEVTGTGDFRLKGVKLDEGTDVDIDITFAAKTDKVAYSTDMALQDRLETIKKNDPEKYNYVVANILLAKRLLKDAGAYKPDRGEVPQGGLGGVGIENWILQNGGSFEDAARSFLEAAEGKTFEEFRATYQIWDFGDNHLAEKRGHYSHDNFVTGNMSSEGYSKMVHALRTYQKAIDKEKGSTETTVRGHDK